MYDTDYRDSIAHSIAVIIENNDAEFHETLRTKTIERLRHGAGYPDMTTDEYRNLRTRDGEHEMAHIILDVIRDTVYDEALKGVPRGLGRTLLSDLLDYGSVDVWKRVAYSYVPELADYARAIGDPEADLY